MFREIYDYYWNTWALLLIRGVSKVFKKYMLIDSEIETMVLLAHTEHFIAWGSDPLHCVLCRECDLQSIRRTGADGVVDRFHWVVDEQSCADQDCKGGGEYFAESLPWKALYSILLQPPKGIWGLLEGGYSIFSSVLDATKISEIFLALWGVWGALDSAWAWGKGTSRAAGWTPVKLDCCPGGWMTDAGFSWDLWSSLAGG